METAGDAANDEGQLMSNDQLSVEHRLSEGTKNLLRELVIGSRLEDRIERLIELLEAGVNIPDLGFISAKLDLIIGLIENEGPITNLTRKVDELMATQEERLQAILAAVKSVKQMLADLKVNNPQIEDEITAIEAELAPATEPTPTPTEPTP